MKYNFLAIAIPCMLLATTNVFSQTGLADKFFYDDAGNRIRREYLVTSLVKNNHEEEPVDTLREASEDKHFAGKGILVKAYPNPVADEMIVENLSWKDGSIATVKIADITGRSLQEKTFKTAKEQFSLSSFAPGTYTVSYYLNNYLYTTWKIIKK